MAGGAAGSVEHRAHPQRSRRPRRGVPSLERYAEEREKKRERERERERARERGGEIERDASERDETDRESTVRTLSDRDTRTGALSHERYRGSSLINNSADLGPYSRAMLRNPWWS